MEEDKLAKNEITMLDIATIVENPFQPRKDFDESDIEDLADSILTHGLIQPVIVRKTADHYQIVAGERRLRATKKLGRTQIPAIIVDLDGVEVAEISLIENIQRKNLNCIEEAVAFGILKSKFAMTAEDIAKRIGKSRPYVSNIMRLISLPDHIKEALFNEQISMGHGRALLSLEDAERQNDIFQLVLRNSLSVRQTEDIIAKALAVGKEKKERKRHKIENELFDDARDYYMEIKRLVGDLKSKVGKADIIERETEEYIELIVRIAK